MDISSSQQNNKKDIGANQKQFITDENPLSLTPQERIQNFQQFETTQTYLPEQSKESIDVDMKLYIGQDVYRKKSKIHNYEDLQQIAQKLIKSHHAHIEGKIQIKYVDSDKDQVNIYDQESLQTAIEDLPNTNSKHILKVYAEFVQVSDSKLPNLTLSFSSQHRTSVCLNCANSNNSNCSHNHLQQQDSYNTIEQIGNQITQKSTSQNINYNPLTISSFFQNESDIQPIDDEDDEQSSKDEYNPQKVNLSFNSGQMNQTQTNNILQTPIKANDKVFNSMNMKQFYQPKQDYQIGDQMYSQGQQINGQFENKQLPSFEQQLYIQQQYNRKGSNQYINPQASTIQHHQQFPQINTFTPQMNNQFSYMNNYNPQINNQFPQINNYIPYVNNHVQQMNPQIPSTNQYNPYINQQGPQMNYQIPFTMNQFAQPNQQIPYFPPHAINQLDPNYQQYLQLQDYIQNMNNNYYNQQPQKNLDQELKQQNSSTPNQFNPHVLNGNYIRQSSTSNFQNQQQTQQQFQHNYSHSANYQANSTFDGESTDCLSAKSNEKNEQIDQNIQYNQSRFKQNNSFDEGFHKQNVNHLNINQQQKQRNVLEDQQIDEQAKNKNFKNRKSTQDEINNQILINNRGYNNEQANNNDFYGSMKSQQYEQINSNIKQNISLHQENYNNISSDSDQTVRNISTLSGFHSGVQNEIKQNIPQAMNQGDFYKNQIKGDNTITASKNDNKNSIQPSENINIQQNKQNSTPNHLQSIKNLKMPSPKKLSKQQSRNSDKGMSKSVEQELYKMETVLVHSQQVKQKEQFYFNEYIEESIVIQNASDSMDNHQYPKYYSTLKQIQKKTVEEIKKDPNTTECVQELLSNEKCKFCLKNLMCRYKDKSKLILTIVNHKIKQILPYLRPLIEQQIESKRKNQIRVFNSSKNFFAPSYQIRQDQMNQKDFVIQENLQTQQLQLQPNQNFNLDQQQQNTPKKNQSANKDINIKQENDQIQTDKKYLNDYTFQNLNEHFGDHNSRRGSIGSQKSPRHSSSFDSRSDQIIDQSQNINQQQHRSLSDLPDEPLSISYQFGSPSEQLNYKYEMQNKQQHFNQQRLYSNFSKEDSNLLDNSISNSGDQNLNNFSHQNNFELYNDSKVGKNIKSFQMQDQIIYNYFGSQNMSNNTQKQQNENSKNNLQQQNKISKQSNHLQNGQLDKVISEYQIYENVNSNEDEEETKEQKPEKKQIKPGGKEQMKHEQSQQYSVEFPEYSQNQMIDCYPGEKRDILIEVKNTGKKNWDTNNFYLKCIKGPFEDKKFPPTKKIQVGEDGQVHIQVKVPSEIKTHITSWRMFETKSTSWQTESAFGSVVQIQFTVKQPPFVNHSFWTNLKSQLYQLVDPNDKQIDKKVHDFIKTQQLLYNHSEIKKDKAEQLFATIINQYFDS